MEWLDKMNAAIEYIENHLSDEIDYEKVAQKACCSSYNFQRMFSFITDVPLAEYIRKRRLTKAAIELQNREEKVIHIAYKYGYQSPSSFARAFQSFHGITPNAARKKGVELKAYPKISFQISIKGGKEMDYRIEEKESFSIFGLEVVASLKGEGMSPAMFWQQSHENGAYEQLVKNAGDTPSFLSKNLCKVHGVEHYKATTKDTFSYMLFAFKSENSQTKGYQEILIPKQTYVVFKSDHFEWDELPNILSEMHKRFYTEWLPTASYERAEGPNFEIYGGDQNLGYIELWYPINK